MPNQLISFINSIKIDTRIKSFDEASTKQVIILRILSLLEWDVFNIDEVKPEYSVGTMKVDYSLRINNINKVFIEVKRIGEDLEIHQDQLLNYSFQQGVKLSILTNGITWWFYLPLHEGSWEQRKFYTIDIIQQESEDVVNKFIDFLLKDNISSGKSIQNAEAIYKGQQKLNILKETLPKAWNKIIEETDELLMELINETTEKMCGYKADSEMIEQFLLKNKDIFMVFNLNNTDSISKKPEITHYKSYRSSKSYKWKSISHFNFLNSEYEVRSWKELLIKLCEVIYGIHKSDFDKTLRLIGRKRPYFTRNRNELRHPEKIKNTNIFVETNLSANGKVKLCFDLISLFGYSNNDLVIKTI